MLLDERQRAAVLAGLQLLKDLQNADGAVPKEVKEHLANAAGPPLRDRQLAELMENIFHCACRTPTVVLKTYCAPVVNEVFANSPVNVVFLDEDTEGCEPETVGQVEGNEVWMGRFASGDADEDRVREVLKQVDAAERKHAQAPIQRG